MRVTDQQRVEITARHLAFERVIGIASRSGSSATTDAAPVFKAPARIEQDTVWRGPVRVTRDVFIKFPLRQHNRTQHQQ